eukprot:TRINITY_DN2860_c0_g1_i2.p1 TRINITY_DN2860_c0_g1~~TRINITY_DN2860_c0_g1_i2.p1  ORF type:complete len:351 (+),score=50.87 TRINITY_DN2860_c0_g1_i2:57-1109(+)
MAVVMTMPVVVLLLLPVYVTVGFVGHLVHRNRLIVLAVVLHAASSWCYVKSLDGHIDPTIFVAEKLRGVAMNTFLSLVLSIGSWGLLWRLRRRISSFVLSITAVAMASGDITTHLSDLGTDLQNHGSFTLFIVVGIKGAVIASWGLNTLFNVAGVRGKRKLAILLIAITLLFTAGMRVVLRQRALWPMGLKGSKLDPNYPGCPIDVSALPFMESLPLFWGNIVFGEMVCPPHGERFSQLKDGVLTVNCTSGLDVLVVENEDTVSGLKNSMIKFLGLKEFVEERLMEPLEKRFAYVGPVKVKSDRVTVYCGHRVERHLSPVKLPDEALPPLPPPSERSTPPNVRTQLGLTD